jgi:hypothetical protein
MKNFVEDNGLSSWLFLLVKYFGMYNNGIKVYTPTRIKMKHGAILKSDLDTF